MKEKSSTIKVLRTSILVLAVLFLMVGMCYTQNEELDMVLIPAGEFLMGSTDGYPEEKPVHKVYLDDYYIDKYEVTNEEFCQFLNKEGNQVEDGDFWLNIYSRVCLIECIDGKYQPKPGYENHPVVCVNWYGARAYAMWAGKRLPTEAEWEKAARVGCKFERVKSFNHCNPKGLLTILKLIVI